MTQNSDPRLENISIAAVFLLASPALWLTYIPFTDLPQHVAMVSILQQFNNEALRFSEFYTVSPWRTLYWLPYAVALPLSVFFSSKTAFAIVTFLSLTAYPLGLRALLKAYQRPGFYLLFGLPFVYSRATFWGFVNFNFAIGFAFLAWSLVVQKEKQRPLLILAVSICGLLSHIYFVGIVGLLCMAHCIVYRGQVDIRRLLVLVPAGIISLLWLFVFSQAEGDLRTQDISLYGKLLSIPMELNGGFLDTSDSWLGSLTAGGLLLLMLFTLIRLTKTGSNDKILLLAAIFFAGNFLLYLILPLHTSTAKFVFFRHAILAACILPLALPPKTQHMGRLKGFGCIIACLTIFNIFVQMKAFDEESAPFAQIDAHIQPGGTTAGLIFEHHSVVRTSPYLHFHAYIQATKGGLISSTFAKFWNIPVQLRPEKKIPKSFLELEWQPKNFDETKYPGLTDYVIARTNHGVVFPQTDYFPFHLVASEGPWQLYKKTSLNKSLRTQTAPQGSTNEADHSRPSTNQMNTAEENQERRP